VDASRTGASNGEQMSVDLGRKTVPGRDCGGVDPGDSPGARNTARLLASAHSLREGPHLQIALVLFEHLTAMDAIGPYEVLSRLPEASLITVGSRRGAVRTDTGMLGLSVDATYAEVPAPDVVVVPGGFGQREHRDGSELTAWLQAVDAGTQWTTSACTGSLILAGAGLLNGRRATTHWLAFDDLAELGAVPAHERVVVDGKYVTAAGVSAGIDMALSLAADIAGDEYAQAIQLGIEYDPRPPFSSGHPDSAPSAAVDAVTAVRDFIV
jgi:transcriptional regulator GlxA family with amidase domain